MTAICPAGPPKLKSATRTQVRVASLSDGYEIASAPSSAAAPDSSAVRFAIKTLLKRRLHHPEYVDRFAQEAELHRRQG